MKTFCAKCVEDDADLAALVAEKKAKVIRRETVGAVGKTCSNCERTFDGSQWQEKEDEPA